MKKLLGIILLGLVSVAISACTMNQSTVDSLSTEQSLSSMAYISSNFLNLSEDSSSTALSLMLSEDGIEVEEELETVNDYLVMLKAFMEKGATEFGQISESASDRVEYQNMISIVVNEDLYLLYYNVNQETEEITGIFILDEVEYEITAYNNLDDKDDDEDDDDEEEYEDDEEFDNDDNDDEEEEDEVSKEDLSSPITTENTTTTTNIEEQTTLEKTEEETEQKMILVARNGDDYIEMTYKVETEENESETKFEMVSYIAGIENEIEIKIAQEADEYKVEIQDEDNYYEFKREVEDEGTKYKLEYEVNEVEGEIEILETEDELGNTVYIYDIDEDGKHKSVEIDKDDDEEDEDEDEKDDLEETSFII